VVEGLGPSTTSAFFFAQLFGQRKDPSGRSPIPLRHGLFVRMERIIKTAELQKHHAAAIDWTSIMRKHYALACGVIKRRMPRGLRARYDPEDFVGDAIVELMTNRARFIEFGPDLLVLIAKRRMIDAARSPRSRVRPLDEDLIDRQPSVALEDDAAALRELMLHRAGNPGDRVVVDLRCQGHTLPEIAELTGRGLRTVQRFFKDFTEANEPY
jgi:DNA-directed RNA polymerase specialized sigma24 family protein